MAHISGHDRSQTLLFPESVDDYVDPDNPVRFIDAFVDGLDLTAAGFVGVDAKGLDLGSRTATKGDTHDAVIMNLTPKCPCEGRMERLCTSSTRRRLLRSSHGLRTWDITPSASRVRLRNARRSWMNGRPRRRK